MTDVNVQPTYPCSVVLGLFHAEAASLWSVGPVRAFGVDMMTTSGDGEIGPPVGGGRRVEKKKNKMGNLYMYGLD